MNNPIILELPFPPTVNHYWFRKVNQYFIGSAGKHFRKAVLDAVRPLRLKPLEGDLELSIDLYPPTRRKPDLDNRVKGIQDSLQHAGLYEDDSQIASLSVLRCEVFPGGKCVVGIQCCARG